MTDTNCRALGNIFLGLQTALGTSVNENGSQEENISTISENCVKFYTVHSVISGKLALLSSLAQIAKTFKIIVENSLFCFDELDQCIEY